MKKGDLQKFSEEVSAIDWSPVFEEKECPTKALDCLMEFITPIYDRTCPVKVIKGKKLVSRKP
jgi:hypothetical protein